jgi:hypothetical protein
VAAVDDALPHFGTAGAAFRADPFGAHRRYREISPVHRNSTCLWLVPRSLWV